jgi:integrase
MLFGASWERYLAEHVRPNLKESTANEIERLGEKLILPKLRRRKLAEIAPHDIKALVAAQKARGAPMQGNKVFVTIRGFFNWTRRELLLTESPCAGLQKPEPDGTRDRVLSDHEIRWVWRACDEIGFPFGPMTKLLLLTAARREEVRGIVQRELDRDAHLWTLPGKRTKNGREHAIHVADATMAVLKAIPKIRNSAGLIFSTNGETPCSGFCRAKTRLDTLMAQYAKADGKEFEPWRIHDLRRTAASGMARIGIALPVIERALNHVSGSFAGIVGVYQRHEFTAEKATAFNAWAGYITRLVTPNAINNIA